MVKNQVLRTTMITIIGFVPSVLIAFGVNSLVAQQGLSPLVTIAVGVAGLMAFIYFGTRKRRK